jgi:hypothetical protein
MIVIPQCLLERVTANVQASDGADASLLGRNPRRPALGNTLLWLDFARQAVFASWRRRFGLLAAARAM